MKRSCALLWMWAVALGVQAGEDFSGKDLQKRNFDNRNLEGANFEDANLTLAQLNDCTLTKANFKDADVTSASFKASQMAGADFRGAIIQYTGFQEADLSGANFQGTELNNVSFQRCKMKGANLQNSKRIGDVQNTDLRDADLRGAVFTCTVYYMNGCRLTGAKYDKNTRWPKGFDVDSSGAVLTEATEKPTPSGTTSTEKPPASAPRKAPDLDAEKLSEDIIKYLLETQMWGSKDGKGFTYRYQSLKMAPPRVGDFRTDGTPAKRETMVTPVRVQVEIIKDLGNNDSTTTSKYQEYVFFRDEFGTWTYRFLGNRE